MNKRIYPLAFACVLIGQVLSACVLQSPSSLATPTPAPTQAIIADCFLSFDMEAWTDENHNGSRDASERPLQGVEFTLDGPVAHSVSGTTVTSNSDGQAHIDVWQPGSCLGEFEIAAIPPEGYELTTKSPLTVASIASWQVYEFGFSASGHSADEVVYSVLDAVWQRFMNSCVKDSGGGLTSRIEKIEGGYRLICIGNIDHRGALIITRPANLKLHRVEALVTALPPEFQAERDWKQPDEQYHGYPLYRVDDRASPAWVETVRLLVMGDWLITIEQHDFTDQWIAFPADSVLDVVYEQILRAGLVH